LALVLALFVVAVLEVVWELPVVAAVVVGLTVGPSALSVVVLLLCPARIAKTEARIAIARAINTGQPHSLSVSGRAFRQRSARLALPVSPRRAPQTKQYS
jgi:hypothetical protein